MVKGEYATFNPLAVSKKSKRKRKKGTPVSYAYTGGKRREKSRPTFTPTDERREEEKARGGKKGKKKSILSQILRCGGRKGGRKNDGAPVRYRGPV